MRIGPLAFAALLGATRAARFRLPSGHDSLEPSTKTQHEAVSHTSTIAPSTASNTALTATSITRSSTTSVFSVQEASTTAGPEKRNETMYTTTMYAPVPKPLAFKQSRDQQPDDSPLDDRPSSNDRESPERPFPEPGTSFTRPRNARRSKKRAIDEEELNRKFALIRRLWPLIFIA